MININSIHLFINRDGRIAYSNDYICEEGMREIAKPMLNYQYGKYLLKVIDEIKEKINVGTLREESWQE